MKIGVVACRRRHGMKIDVIGKYAERNLAYKKNARNGSAFFVIFSDCTE